MINAAELFIYRKVSHISRKVKRKRSASIRTTSAKNELHREIRRQKNISVAVKDAVILRRAY